MEGKRKQRNKTFSKDISYYELLGLEDISAGEKEIKKAFRKLSLIYHPDKYEEGKYDDNAKSKWLAFQTAYETLMDDTKRHIYDATMEFDEEIPEAKLPEDQDFYEVYTAYFKRNLYWSTDQKKAQAFGHLGDDSTTWNLVKKFYEFWDGFQTWRDFKMDDEYDVMQAENRYEKRWMENENKKMKKELYKKERVRVQLLVSRAKALDPRVLKKETEEREAKEKVKKEKEEKKQKVRDDKERVIRERREEVERVKLEEETKVQKEKDARLNKKAYYKAKCQSFKDVIL